MFSDISDAVIVLNGALAVRKALLLLDAHPAFRNEPWDIPVFGFQAHGHIIHNLRVDFPTARSVHPSAGQGKLFIIVFRMERCLLVPLVTRGPDPFREIQIDPEIVHRIFFDDEQFLL